MNNSSTSAARLDTAGSAIRTMREAMGLTLSELGQLAGISPSYLSQLERGNRPLRDTPVLAALTEALGWHLIRASREQAEKAERAELLRLCGGDGAQADRVAELADLFREQRQERERLEGKARLRVVS